MARMFLDDLRDAVSDAAIVTDPDILATHSRDEADLCDAGRPVALVRDRKTHV